MRAKSNMKEAKEELKDEVERFANRIDIEAASMNSTSMPCIVHFFFFFILFFRFRFVFDLSIFHMGDIWCSLFAIYSTTSIFILLAMTSFDSFELRVGARVHGEIDSYGLERWGRVTSMNRIEIDV